GAFAVTAAVAATAAVVRNFRRETCSPQSGQIFFDFMAGSPILPLDCNTPESGGNVSGMTMSALLLLFLAAQDPTVPDGFAIRKVAEAAFPMFACFDDRGRLYV